MELLACKISILSVFRLSLWLTVDVRWRLTQVLDAIVCGFVTDRISHMKATYQPHLAASLATDACCRDEVSPEICLAAVEVWLLSAKMPSVPG
jgi:hypothetical protein